MEKLYLVYSPKIFKKADKPIVLEWSDFSPKDEQIIKAKQKEIFENKIRALLKDTLITF